MPRQPHQCDTCGAETDSVYRLASMAGKDRVMVRFFCNDACYEPFIEKQNAIGGCSWCGLSVPASAVRGPMGEHYCNEACYESAGKALFRFNMLEDPGDGEVIRVTRDTDP